MTWLLFSMIRVINTPRVSCKSKLAKYITFLFFTIMIAVIYHLLKFSKIIMIFLKLSENRALQKTHK